MPTDDESAEAAAAAAIREKEAERRGLVGRLAQRVGDARETVQRKTTARRAKKRAKSRKKRKREQRIQAGTPEGVREEAAVLRDQLNEAGSDVGELAGELGITRERASMLKEQAQAAADSGGNALDLVAGDGNGGGGGGDVLGAFEAAEQGAVAIDPDNDGRVDAVGPPGGLRSADDRPYDAVETHEFALADGIENDMNLDEPIEDDLGL